MALNEREDRPLPEPEHFSPCGDDFGFIITTTKATTYAVAFTVVEIVGVSVGPEPIERDTEPYLNCSIKWDSCSHFWFPRDGYIHLCGVRTFASHAALLRRLYFKAFEVMGRAPEEGEEWPTASVTEERRGP